MRLMAAEEAAREAKDAVVGQADIAKIERERALASRAEAEMANKNLDSARCCTICMVSCYVLSCCNLALPAQVSVKNA